MELRHVRSFLSLAKTLNFSRTAEIVHLSQPALRLQIQSLEEEIAGKLFERDRRKTVLTASFHILPRLLEKIRSALPLVNVELKEGPEDPQITGLRSGAFDVCIRHLSRTYDQIENMLLIRERLVVALPKGHSAAPVALEEPCSNLILKSSVCRLSAG